MGPITIATEADAAEIARLRTAVAEDLSRQFGHGYWSSVVTETSVARGLPHARVAILRADDAIVGGVTLETDYRKATLKLHIAPWLPDADALRAAALRLVHPWIRDDLELMAFVLHIPADQPETIAAAEALGMELGVRFREGIARPGHRVDELIYQALFDAWVVRDA